MRGEYSQRPTCRTPKSELPPRARRIRVGILPVRLIMGTTSACAENTYMMCRLLSSVWNYLRVRGEYSNTALKVSGSTELPPRARRIPRATPPRYRTGGTTSAHAENTNFKERLRSELRNYLRARGEYGNLGGDPELRLELPPRTRRIRIAPGDIATGQGTTSAHAENTEPLRKKP